MPIALTDERRQLFEVAHRFVDGTVKRAAASALVTSATKTFGHARDIEFALAAQADPAASVGQFTEERGHLHIADGQHVIDQAFAVFLFGVAKVHLLLRDPDPAQATVKI